MRGQRLCLAIAILSCSGCLPRAELTPVEGPGGHHRFLLDRYEVSVRDYRMCVRLGACTRPSSGRGPEWKRVCVYFRRMARKGDYPVDCVSATQAQEYCEWRGGRLPTLDEWRWEATGNGRAWTYPWGTGPEPDCRNATVLPRDGRVCAKTGVTPVRSNPLGRSINGVYNLLGNVEEWVTVSGGVDVVGVSYYYSEPLSEKYFEGIGREVWSLADAPGEITFGFRCAYDTPL